MSILNIGVGGVGALDIIDNVIRNPDDPLAKVNGTAQGFALLAGVRELTDSTPGAAAGAILAGGVAATTGVSALIADVQAGKDRLTINGDVASLFGDVALVYSGLASQIPGVAATAKTAAFVGSAAVLVSYSANHPTFDSPTIDAAVSYVVQTANDVKHSIDSLFSSSMSAQWQNINTKTSIALSGVSTLLNSYGTSSFAANANVFTLSIQSAIADMQSQYINSGGSTIHNVVTFNSGSFTLSADDTSKGYIGSLAYGVSGLTPSFNSWDATTGQSYTSDNIALSSGSVSSVRYTYGGTSGVQSYQNDTFYANGTKTGQGIAYSGTSVFDGGNITIADGANCSVFGTGVNLSVGSASVVQLDGVGNTVNVNGLSSTVVDNATGDTAYINGQIDTYVMNGANGGLVASSLSSRDTIYINGKSDVATINATNCGVASSGASDTIYVNSSGTNLTISGNNSAGVMNGQNETLYLTGAGDTGYLTNANDSVVLSGSSGTIYVSGSNDIADVQGNSNGALITGNNATLYLEGSGNSATVNGNNSGVQVTQNSNTVYVNGTGDNVSLTGNNNAAVLTGASNGVTIAGSGNTAYLNGAGEHGATSLASSGATFVVNGNNSTIDAAHANISVASGASATSKLTSTITGFQNTISVGSYDTVSVNLGQTNTGALSNTVTIAGSNSSVNMGGDGSNLIVNGNNNSGQITGQSDNLTMNGNNNSFGAYGVSDVVTSNGTSNLAVIYGASETVTLAGDHNTASLYNAATTNLRGTNTIFNNQASTLSQTINVYNNAGALNVNYGSVSIVDGASAQINGNVNNVYMGSSASATIVGSRDGVYIYGNNSSVSVSGSNDHTIAYGAGDHVTLSATSVNDDTHLCGTGGVYVNNNKSTTSGNTLYNDPVILNLDGNGVSTVSVDASSVAFDVMGDGIKVLTGWASAGEGMLVYDPLNRNMVASEKDLVSNFDELRSLDTNNDNLLNNLDAAWSNLKVWVDADGSGNFEASALLGIDKLGIASIKLDVSHVNRDDNGNLIADESTFNWKDGRAGNIAGVFLASRGEVSSSVTQSADVSVTSASSAAVYADKAMASVDQLVAAMASFAPSSAMDIVGSLGSDSILAPQLAIAA